MNQELIDLLIVRDPYCIVCGKPDTLQIHHIKPRSQGGDDTKENTCRLCMECHAQAQKYMISKEFLFRILKGRYGYE